MNNIMNHKRDTAMNEENMAIECKRQIIASRNGGTCCFGREIFWFCFYRNQNNETFFLTETFVIAVMQVRNGLNKNDTIRLER